MVQDRPTTTLDARYGDPGATATPWAEAEAHLARAEIYWLTTIRPEGRPHVTPLIAIWHEQVLYFCTGEQERKARNLAAHRQIAVTTGQNTMGSGLDLVIEGEARRVGDEALLRLLAGRYATKYEGWHFTVRDGAFHGEGGRAIVFAVAPARIFGFRKGDVFSQTRWDF